MTELPPEVEQQLASMTPEEWSAFSSRVRAPDSGEQLRTIAGSVLSGAALDSFVNYADVSKFTGADGMVDEEKVMGYLTAAIGGSQGADARRQWGQHSGGSGPVSRPGEGGRAAAAQRFGTKVDSEETVRTGRGAAGRAAAAKRFGTKEKS
jgi:hypothetical protein